MGQQLPTLPLGENSAEELISCISRVQNCVLAMIFGGRRDFEGALEEVADAEVFTVRNVLGTSRLAKCLSGSSWNNGLHGPCSTKPSGRLVRRSTLKACNS
jgi:hypothetical protein